MPGLIRAGAVGPAAKHAKSVERASRLPPWWHRLSACAPHHQDAGATKIFRNSRVGCALRTFIMHRRDACATKFSLTFPDSSSWTYRPTRKIMKSSVGRASPPASRSAQAGKPVPPEELFEAALTVHFVLNYIDGA